MAIIPVRAGGVAAVNAQNATFSPTVDGHQAGNTLLVFAGGYNSNEPLTCADTQGNTYVRDGSRNSGGRWSAIFRSLLDTSLSSSDVITVHASASGSLACESLEVSGLGDDPVAAVTSAGASSSGTVNPGTLDLEDAGDLVVATGFLANSFMSGGIVPSAGYTAVAGTLTISASRYMRAWYRVVASAADGVASTATYSGTNSGSALAIAYKAGTNPTAWKQVALNAMAAAVADNITYVSLHSGYPATAANEIEVTRQAITLGDPVGGTVADSTGQEFTVPAGADVAAVGYWSAETDGDLWADFRAYNPAQSFASGGTCHVTSTQLTVSQSA